MPAFRNTQPGPAKKVVPRSKRPRHRASITPINDAELDFKLEKSRKEFESRVMHCPADAQLWLRYAQFEATNKTGKALSVLHRGQAKCRSPHIAVEMLKHDPDPNAPTRILGLFPNSRVLRDAVLPYLSPAKAREKLEVWCSEDPDFYAQLIALEKKENKKERVGELYEKWALSSPTNTRIWVEATEYVRVNGSQDKWRALCATAIGYLFFQKPEKENCSRRIVVADNFFRHCDWPIKDQEELIKKIMDTGLEAGETALLIKHRYRIRLPKTMAIKDCCVRLESRVQTTLHRYGRGVDVEKLFAHHNPDLISFMFEGYIAHFSRPNVNSTELETCAAKMWLYAKWRDTDSVYERVMSVFQSNRTLVLSYISFLLKKPDPASAIAKALRKFPGSMYLSVLVEALPEQHRSEQMRSVFYDHTLNGGPISLNWHGLIRLEEYCGNLDACRNLFELAIDQFDPCPFGVWSGYYKFEQRNGSPESAENILARWTGAEGTENSLSHMALDTRGDPVESL